MLDNICNQAKFGDFSPAWERFKIYSDVVSIIPDYVPEL